jgi:hypothetical protein
MHLTVKLTANEYKKLISQYRKHKEGNQIKNFVDSIRNFKLTKMLQVWNSEVIKLDVFYLLTHSLSHSLHTAQSFLRS